jgi:hypothetical protein
MVSRIAAVAVDRRALDQPVGDQRFDRRRYGGPGQRELAASPLARLLAAR